MFIYCWSLIPFPYKGKQLLHIMWFVTENPLEETLTLENPKGFSFDSWPRFCLTASFSCMYIRITDFWSKALKTSHYNIKAHCSTWPSTYMYISVISLNRSKRWMDYLIDRNGMHWSLIVNSRILLDHSPRGLILCTL